MRIKDADSFLAWSNYFLVSATCLGFEQRMGKGWHPSSVSYTVEGVYMRQNWDAILSPSCSSFAGENLNLVSIVAKNRACRFSNFMHPLSNRKVDSHVEMLTE